MANGADVAKKRTLVFALVLVVAIVAGIILYFMMRPQLESDIKSVVLSESGVTQKELKFSVDDLKPGASRDYSLDVTVKATAGYELNLAFNEKKDGGLREFVVVAVEFGEDRREALLDELFDGTAIAFDCELTADEPIQLHFTFEMPLDVGNEAQGATSDFVVILTAKRV